MFWHFLLSNSEISNSERCCDFYEVHPWQIKVCIAKLLGPMVTHLFQQEEALGDPLLMYRGLPCLNPA